METKIKNDIIVKTIFLCSNTPEIVKDHSFDWDTVLTYISYLSDIIAIDTEFISKLYKNEEKDCIEFLKVCFYSYDYVWQLDTDLEILYRLYKEFDVTDLSAYVYIGSECQLKSYYKDVIRETYYRNGPSELVNFALENPLMFIESAEWDLEIVEIHIDNESHFFRYN